MAESFRLLLGAKATSLSDIRLPAFCSYKVDGWRGFWQGLEFFTRSGKCIPNRQLQKYASQLYLPPGLDGEIIVGEPNAPDVFDKTNRYCKTARALLGEIGDPVARFFVFDLAGQEPFWQRLEGIRELHPFVVRLDQHLIENYDDLEAFEANAVALGYEGICTRSPNGRYKAGRSTLKEQYLVKVKRYIDGEFRIIGAVEKMHNANPAFISETGHSKRSSHQDGKIPAGTLGALVVDWNGRELHVGTGWNHHAAAELWERHLRGDLVGDFATIRYSPPTKDLPRQPVFKAIRYDI